MPPRDYIDIEDEESEGVLLRADDDQEDVAMYELEDDVRGLQPAVEFSFARLDPAVEARVFENFW